MAVHLKILLSALVGLTFISGAVRAQDKSDKPPDTSSGEEMTPVSDGDITEKEQSTSKTVEEAVAEASVEKPADAAPKPLPGPKYLNLRYDEDFSYLDGEPGTYVEDFWDPIKNIRIGEDWRLSLGGEFRFRLESLTNPAFDNNRRTQDTYQLYRYLLHADLKYKDVFRVFVQGIVAHEEDHDYADRPIDRNITDLHQLFMDIKPFGSGTPLMFRVGRQELQYGAQRFISPLDWANTRRRFDAVKAVWKAESWQFDAFYAKPIPIKRYSLDSYDEEFDLYGAYFTYKGIPRHNVDLFFFGIDDTRNRVNPNGNAGDVTRFTMGGILRGKTAGFDYTGVLAGQWGRWAGDTIQAWAWTLDGGYTFEQFDWKPRIGAGFDWASGDDDPNDSSVGTFDQLFPLGHAYLGYLDEIGRQNVKAVNVNLSAWPIPKKVRGRVAWHAFMLTEREDAWYNVAGRPVRRDPTGRSGRDLGHELDVTLLWKIDVHSDLLFGYSHFWEGNFIQNTGKSENPDFIYLQYRYRF
ncbi:MAG: alginate export family protein [Planctomycetota bacterium]|jgi:hypothetical protein